MGRVTDDEPDPLASEPWEKPAPLRAVESNGHHPDDEYGPIGEPPSDHDDTPAHDPRGYELDIFDMAELVRRVDKAPPVSWLVQPLWPADAHGVMAATQKAGKSWAGLDLAVSVASGTPWMGLYPAARPGNVLVFLGEGGERKMRRRLDAICEARSLSLAELPIHACFRMPHLTSTLHMDQIREEIAAWHPVLVILDPLYLAATGAKGSQLYEMGDLLERAQILTQNAGAALVVVHHWNQTGKGSGAGRMSGAGPAEWGRVLVSVSVKSKVTDSETMATKVVLDWVFEGDEIPDTHLRILRTVSADDPDDLNSPMHYSVEKLSEDKAATDETDYEGKAGASIVALLSKMAGGELSKTGTVKALKDEGFRYRAQTVYNALDTLAKAGTLRKRTGGRNAQFFSWVESEENPLPLDDVDEENPADASWLEEEPF